MTQTANGLSFRDCAVGLSTNGVAWTDISGFAASVGLGNGRRLTGDAYTFDGDTAIVTAGKREPLLVVVHAVYTEGAGEPFEMVRAAYEAAAALYVRWSPKGGAPGSLQYTTAAGIVVTPPYPSGEARPGAPVLFSFTLKTPAVTKSVIP